MLGFPALVQSLKESGARSPKFGLGVPSRAYDEVRERTERHFAPVRQVIAFEQGDYTPEWMRTPQKPLKWPPLPDADGWIKWEGGDRPVDAAVSVQVRLRGGINGGCVAGDLAWYQLGCGADIVAYRVVA
jgi:hypothetical protein